MRLHPAVASTMIAVGGLMLMSMGVVIDVEPATTSELHGRMLGGILATLITLAKLTLAISLIGLGVYHSFSRRPPQQSEGDGPPDSAGR